MAIYTTNIEELPYPIQVMIMYRLGSFIDLYRLVRVSPIFRRVFEIYPYLCLTGVARNILGDSWKDATTILVWQRHGGLTPDFPKIKEALKKKFKIQMGDISQLVNNQLFFNSCRVLPMRMFYEMWLLSLRFGHESLEAFARRKPISLERILDLVQMSRMVVASRYFRGMVALPRWIPSHMSLKDHIEIFPAVSTDLFTFLSCECDACYCLRRDTMRDYDEKNNPLLKLKVGSHLVASIKKYRVYATQANRNTEASIIIGRSYPNMTIEAMVQAYDLENWKIDKWGDE